MNHNTDCLLEIQDLSVRRGNFLLEHINFSLQQNEILSIIGKTGSGKTLLLKAVAGFYQPDQGKVLCGGTPMCEIPVFRRHIGSLYQDYSLFPHMTAFSNIAFGPKIQGVPKAEIQASVKEIAAQFEIEHILDQYPGTLSGGKQQRVALARADRAAVFASVRRTVFRTGSGYKTQHVWYDPENSGRFLLLFNFCNA